MSDTVVNLDRLAAQHAQNLICCLVDNDKDGRKRDAQNQKDREDIQKAANKTDTAVTKALGVLQEDGVYACFLYLLAKEKPTKEEKEKKQKSTGEEVVESMLNLLEELGFSWNKPVKEDEKINLSPDIVLKHITDHVTQDLERLLLAKETLEQMLIYARYGAKARQESDKEKQA